MDASSRGANVAASWMLLRGPGAWKLADVAASHLDCRLHAEVHAARGHAAKPITSDVQSISWQMRA